GLVKKAVKAVKTVGHLAKAAVNSAATVAKFAGSAAAMGAASAIGWGTNWVNSHIGASAMVCVMVCVGLSYMNGHLSVNYGLGTIVGASAGFSYSSVTPNG